MSEMSRTYQPSLRDDPAETPDLGAWRELYADLEDRAKSQVTLREAHVHRRRCHRLAVQLYGATCAFYESENTPEVPPSLATCEQLHIDPAVPDFSTWSLSQGDWSERDLEHLSDLLAEDLPTDQAVSLIQSHDFENGAIEASAKKLARLDVDADARTVLGNGGPEVHDLLTDAIRDGDDRRLPRVLELIKQGEMGHARRLAHCQKQSVELECPSDSLEQGCGGSNFVPVHCDSRLCPTCRKRRLGRLIEKYEDRVADFENPTFLTLTTENVEAGNLPAAVDFIVDKFGLLRRRTVPPSGVTHRQGTTKRWCWAEDGGRPSFRWAPQLPEDVAARLEREYVSEGRNVPVDELIRSGIYSVDVKAAGGGEYNVHLHALADMHYVPQAALSAVWEDLTGAHHVDVRRVYQDQTETYKEALMETLAYAVKAPEFYDVSEEVAYVTETAGRRAVQTFGELHGNAPLETGHLECVHCGYEPIAWIWCGIVEDDWQTAQAADVRDRAAG